MNNIKNLLNNFSQIQEIKSIAIGGSCTAKTADLISDIDIYIFTESEIPIEIRKNIIKNVSSRYEIGAEYFGPGDEFLYDEINKVIDIMYWNKNWFETIVDNVWIKNYASNGYSTCFLYTLNNFSIVYDPDNWLTNLQNKIQTEYPARLQKNIIDRNLKLLKDKPFASYYEQIEKAIQRNDILSINHRITAFLVSYFDIIFAMNKLLHPGEKRLVKYAKNNCKILPENFEKNITEILTQPNPNTLLILNNIIKNLKTCLKSL